MTADTRRLAAGSGVVAFIAFALTQNLRILDPRNIGWLWGSGDIASSFSQWLYFRQTPLLQWPFTINPNYGGSWVKTIVFTDTPPLFALPAKLLFAWVSTPFQYTGLQILISTYLLVLFSALALRRLTGNTWVALSGGALVAVSPMLLFRDVFFHYSLNIMWVIPAGVYLLLGPSTRRSTWGWGLLAFVTLVWMPYFVVCVGVLWAWDLVLKRTTGQLSWRSTAFACVPMALGVALSVVVNALWYEASPAAGFGLGYYNANLLSLVNPQARPTSMWSTVLPGFSVATEGQYEGFAYLGIGVILLLVAYIPARLVARRPHDLRWQPGSKPALLGAAVTCVVIAFGFSVTIGTIELFSVPVPHVLQEPLSIFRSSGRFMLVPGLVITLLAVALWTKVARPALVVTVALVAATLTFLDAHAQIEVNRAQQGVVENLRQGTVDAGALIDEFGVQSVTFIQPESSAYQWKMDIIAATALRNIPVNDAFVARPNDEALTVERDRTMALLATSTPSPDEMWVIYPYVAEEQADRLREIEPGHCMRMIGEAVVVLGAPCPD